MRKMMDESESAGRKLLNRAVATFVLLLGLMAASALLLLITKENTPIKSKRQRRLQTKTTPPGTAWIC